MPMRKYSPIKVALNAQVYRMTYPVDIKVCHQPPQCLYNRCMNGVAMWQGLENTWNQHHGFHIPKTDLYTTMAECSPCPKHKLMLKLLYSIIFCRNQSVA